MIEFEMYTDEGNKSCTEAFQNIYDVIFDPFRFVHESELKALIAEQIARVKVTHPEVHDTEPEWHFVDRINLALKTKGYGYTITRGDL